MPRPRLAVSLVRYRSDKNQPFRYIKGSRKSRKEFKCVEIKDEKELSDRISSNRQKNSILDFPIPILKQINGGLQSPMQSTNADMLSSQIDLESYDADFNIFDADFKEENIEFNNDIIEYF